jgi:glycosyltransferase involved in cell wall biosynthesis
MNVLLNFFPVRAGGGQQVASSFLKIIGQEDFNHKWFLFVGENSELHVLANQYLPHCQIFAYPYSYRARITAIKRLRRFVKDNNIDIIYNYAPILKIPKVPQVVRSVYSNLYFPEIPFWGSYPRHIQWKKRVIDYFRLKWTLKAHGLVFENRSMQERAHHLFSYSLDNTVYIEPSVSIFDETSINLDYQYLREIPDFKVLYLSSWHLNKNLTILPSVAYLLKKVKVKIKFVLSLNFDSAEIKPLVDQIELFGVGDYFTFVGKVKAIHVHQVVKSCDAMILLSKLECFSSNVIEAFYFKKPLIISNEPWARAVCESAAVYVNRDDAQDIFNNIIGLLNDKEATDTLTQKGIEVLKHFNNPREKVVKQVKFLEYIYQKNT